ncbi:MAG: TlpA disulfide reductase family protein, partial [Candidatus Cloacimonadaceae bacterium]|nr:TlpA disulfide reductase family protein [Candidatus Cloacimonadaceae bacterium]
LDSWVQMRRISQDEIPETFTQYHLYIMQQIEDWGAVEQYFLENPSELDNRDRYELLISLNIARNNPERAMDYIATLLREDRTDFKSIEANKEWQKIASGEKWLRMMYEAKLKWDAEEGQRRALALSSDKSIPAYNWELPDIDGNKVKLSDLRGSIVILDFWATWCAPCRMAMPLIDEWMRKKMPAGVRVFSINVWERDPQKAKDFMREKAYAMTLLMGYNELAEHYGFDGIPFICVIDQQGNLRYVESGFSSDLDEKLSFWVEALAGK